LEEDEEYSVIHVTTPGRPSSSQPLGAYGIQVRGLEAAAELLVPVDGRAPAYLVESAVRPAQPGSEHVDDDRAELRLRSGGRVLIDRRGGRVCFEVPHPVRPDELVHPYLAPAAAVIGRWLGRESVHAGAVAVDGRALGVVGARGAGKSSTLAWWALGGGEVLCDDLLMIDGRATFTGPRSIDLREDAAAQLGAGELIGVTGARERWRLQLAPAGDGHVLVGFVFLAWGDSVTVRKLGVGERLQRLVPERSLRLEPARHDALLDLATLPAWEISRPRSWAALPEAGQRLRELVSTTPTAGA
jgi:hypothetical protein